MLPLTRLRRAVAAVVATTVALVTLGTAVPATASPSGDSGVIGGAGRSATGTPGMTPSTWTPPACSSVDDPAGAVSFTRNGGAGIIPTSGTLTPVAYTHVTALRKADSLLAVTKQSIRLSSDSGCSWQEVAEVEQNLSQYDVAAGPDGVAYVYGVNDQPMFRVRPGGEVLERTAPVDGDGVIGLVVDPADPDRVLAMDGDGQLHRSDDGAQTWHQVGTLPPFGRNVLVYTAAFDPQDPDHIVVGCTDTSFVTVDGGQTWEPVTGFTTGTKSDRANVFSVEFSPAESSVVWAEAYDTERTGQAARRIYRSDDGGRTFEGMLDGTEVQLVNGTDLYPDPVDADVLYFVYGTWFMGAGTDLYRFDAGTDAWSNAHPLTQHHNSYDGIDSIAFHPADPSIMYLGLSEVR